MRFFPCHHLLVLGSPGSVRIISAVAQVTSYWIDVDADIEKAVDVFRVHVVPDNKAYIEGPTIFNELLAGIAQYGYITVYQLVNMIHILAAFTPLHSRMENGQVLQIQDATAQQKLHGKKIK